ncbi:MAG: hypothetical protein AB7P33_15495 [Dehalococcoidia bacterium]
MPTVRFQLTALSCSRSEDRGLLDTRSEDEIYIHGAVGSGTAFKPILAGAPPQTAGSFQHLKIEDGQTVAFPESDGTSWSAEVPEEASVLLAFTVHEEDALREWPAVEALRSDLDAAIAKVTELAAINNRPPEPKDLAAATTGVMRGQEKFGVDDLIGEVLESIAVAGLTPETFDRSSRLVGGSRVLASDFDYTVSYRVVRDDRDFRVALETPELISLALLPGESATLDVTFRNAGMATFKADDLVLAGPRELAGWLTEDSDNVTITDDAAGILLGQPQAGPGEAFTFSLKLAAPPVMGRAAYALRLFIPSLKYFVPQPPLSLQLSSGRDIVCEIETIARNGGVDAEIKVVARDAVTGEVVDGTIRVTGEQELYPTSQPFKVHSNMRHLMATPVQKGQDQIVWPFGSVQVEGYWPQLLTLKPA